MVKSEGRDMPFTIFGYGMLLALIRYYIANE